MTMYLLDTNACVALINGAPKEVRRRFQRAVVKEAVILLSSVVAFELWYGVAKSQRKEINTQRLEAFLAGPLEWALFDDGDAREAGTVRAELELAGKPVGAYDVLIAGQARRRNATLVTANVGEFGRIAGLKWEDWAVARRQKSRREA
ncbi:MAG TPA: type II toxin-antitoxin system VapC family toxin [Vicinamibacterales bacterium]|jgi:tRNA(fMet)-specific endonuclease VapC|nr:type II toxin-antitoxin system VapC family toxin [Vicinamibacterales bacterium]